MRRCVAGVAALVAVVMVGGCGGDDDAGGLPTLTPDSSAPTSASTTPGASTTTYTVAPTTPVTNGPTSPPVGFPSKVVAVHRRNVVATTADQKAVADVYLQYVVERLLAFNKAQVDLDALSRVASGRALAVVRERVANLQAKKWHTIGEVWVDISAVTVNGQTATLKSCMDNTTLDVDRAGKAVELPVPYYVATATLKKAGGTTWVVDNTVIAEQRCR